jgi:hypothetical protein
MTKCPNYRNAGRSYPPPMDRTRGLRKQEMLEIGAKMNSFQELISTASLELSGALNLSLKCNFNRRNQRNEAERRS